MTNDLHVQELTTLKTIAETLNQSNDLDYMLDTVLGRLLEVTGLSFGWIFFVNENHDYTCVADRNLPPALLFEEKRFMKCGSCWCLDRYQAGKLKNAVNILNCKRLENARREKKGDTCGFTHHATVPLRIGGRLFGVLNVGSPGKEHFTDEELALLQAVAFQIGVAVERMRLHEAEQRRAELFSRLGEFSRSLTITLSGEDAGGQLNLHAMKLIGDHFDWPFVALLERSGDYFVVRSLRYDDLLLTPNLRIRTADAPWLDQAGRAQGYQEMDAAHISALIESGMQQQITKALQSVIAAPVTFGGTEACGVLVIAHPASCGLNQVDGAVLEAVAEHLAIALENARLEEVRLDLARLEERNRLARDLHDSVSQLLFSISMTAKGVESLLGGEQVATAISAVKDMQALSRDALKEMRALIIQLRPAGVEKGIVTALAEYGTRLGLQVNGQTTGNAALPQGAEEALWRIGQEALNNVSKHAGTSKVSVALAVQAEEILLTVTDYGRGMNTGGTPDASNTSTGQQSFGLSNMRERAEMLGGRFRLTSRTGKGTSIEVMLPLSADAIRKVPEK
ncbi:GAF domain-containing sensor histidine kinase [Bacillus sp. FJAT-26390]|uniref:GAF domain-containing sensor histidine kinase n=1 Tax=Bacillus sp. FJAT-26390 TaxID=1743142 RepID=UPI000807CC88|nr:GAF domain-containing sensor histidine kinase [Bacillus sp. FJAT-26390]OBZ10132.1 hypothetical protein A7975_22495 [Bacillus sp. FJAT-26390]